MLCGPIVPEHRQTASKRIAAYLTCVSSLFLAALLFSFHGGLQAPKDTPAERGISALATENQPRLTASYGKLPLGFEFNQGQTDPQVKFLSRGRGYSLFLTGDAAVLMLRKLSVVSGQSSVGTRQNPSVAPTFRSARGGVAQHPPFGAAALPDPLPLSGPEKTPESEVEKPRDRRAGPALPFSSRRLADTGESSAVVRMKLVGANAKAAVTGAEELPGKSNYFIGNDPKKWRTNVPTYAKVKYENVYPGIDLVYYGNQGGQLEYDFVMAPGADPGAIRLALSGGLEAGSGQSAVGSGTQNRPQRQSKIQNLNPKIDPSGDLVVKTDGGEVRFHKPVVYQEQESEVRSQKSEAKDESRNSKFVNRQSTIVSRQFLEGRFRLSATNQVTFEVSGYDRTRPLVIDPYLSYSTYLGGSVEDHGAAIAVDSSGNAYVTGYTVSKDFPVVNAIQPTYGGGWYDAFVAKLNAEGSALIYSTYLGGSGADQAQSIAVDSSGNAYVIGSTTSTDFPIINALQTSNKARAPDTTVFVAKLNASGSALVYSTYLGGSTVDVGQGIAVEPSGNAYVTGYTWSTDFPTASPLQPSLIGSSNAFVTKLNWNGSALSLGYSTYLGGSGGDRANGIAVDSSGNAYVAGSAGPGLPLVNPLQASYEGEGDAFVAKLNPSGSSLIYSTYLGGSGEDQAQSIAVDSSGNAYVAGFTASTNFPTVSPLQASNKAALSDDATGFVAKLDASGSALVYSTYLGGSLADQGLGIAVDSSGNAYVVGVTYSPDFPTASPLQGPSAEAAFVAELNASGSALIYSTYLGGVNDLDPESWNTEGANGVAVDSNGNAYVTGCTTSENFPTVNPFQAVNKALHGLGPPPYATTGFVAELSPGPAPALSFSTPALNFGSVSTTSQQSVSLTNLGNAPLSITSTAAGGDFALVTTATSCPYGGGTVAPEANCTLDVSFTPTATGARTGTVTVTDNAAGSPQAVALSGTGVLLPAPNVSPTSLSFHNQAVGTTSTPQTVTVTNTGTLALSISSLTTSYGWTQSNNCLPSVAPSASCTINVSFQPTAAGSQTGALTLTDLALGSPQTVSLSGTGVVPAVSLSATSLSFPGETVSIPSPPQPLTLTNTGTGALTPLTIATTGDFAQTNTCAGSIAAGAGCTISVTFTPTAPGDRTGALTLTDNALNSPQTVSLTGTGTGTAVRLSPTALSFGAQLVGSSSLEMLTLTNLGSTPLSISSLSVVSFAPLTPRGTKAGDFAILSSSTCVAGRSVVGLASCAINVVFKPTAAGIRSATLVIADSDPSSPQTVNLRGTGTEARPPATSSGSGP